MVQKRYSGPDRRAFPISDRRDTCANCMDHSGLVQRMNNVESKTDFLESEGFLTSASFRWIIGILISIVVTILSASFFMAYEASQALREIKAAQVTMNMQISYLRSDIETIKRKAP